MNQPKKSCSAGKIDPEQVKGEFGGEIVRTDQQAKESTETGLYLFETQRAIPCMDETAQSGF